MRCEYGVTKYRLTSARILYRCIFSSSTCPPSYNMHYCLAATPIRLPTCLTERTLFIMEGVVDGTGGAPLRWVLAGSYRDAGAPTTHLHTRW